MRGRASRTRQVRRSAIDDQLVPPALEQIEEADLSLRSLEFIVLLDRHPRMRRRSAANCISGASGRFPLLQAVFAHAVVHSSGDGDWGHVGTVSFICIVLLRRSLSMVMVRLRWLLSLRRSAKAKRVMDFFGMVERPAKGVRRDTAALFQWVRGPPGDIAPAGSNRSRHGGDEMSEAFG